MSQLYTLIFLLEMCLLHLSFQEMFLPQIHAYDWYFTVTINAGNLQSI